MCVASTGMVSLGNCVLRRLLGLAESSRVSDWLKPGGRVAFTDYGRGEGNPSEEFKSYVAKRGYQLLTVSQYKDLLEKSGFENVLVEFAT